MFIGRSRRALCVDFLQQAVAVLSGTFAERIKAEVRIADLTLGLTEIVERESPVCYTIFLSQDAKSAPISCVGVHGHLLASRERAVPRGDGRSRERSSI